LRKESSSRMGIEMKIKDILIDIGLGLYQWQIFGIVCFTFFCHGCQIILLSLLLPLCINSYGITQFQASLFFFIEQMGYFLGIFTLNRVCDYFGRKPVLIFYSITLAGFAFFSAFGEDFTYLLAFRFFIGFLSISTAGISYLILSDIMDIQNFGNIQTFLEVTLLLGSFVEIMITSVVMENLQEGDWKLLIMITSGFNIVLAGLISNSVDETISYEIQNKRIPKAIELINKLAKKNLGVENYMSQKKYLDFENWALACLEKENFDQSKNNCRNSLDFGPKIKSISIFLSFLWFVNIMTYTALLLLLPLILMKYFDKDPDSILYLIFPVISAIPSNFSSAEISHFSHDFLKAIFGLSFILVGMLSIPLFFDFWPGFLFYLSLMSLFLNLCLSLKFQYLTNSVPKFYKSQILINANLCGKFGGMAMPWLAMPLINYDLLSPFLVFGMVNIVAGALILCYKVENRKNSNEIDLEMTLCQHGNDMVYFVSP